MQKYYLNLKILAEQLRKGRLYRGYKSQRSFARKMDIQHQYYSHWELARKPPSLQRFLEIADALDLYIGFFLTEGAIPEDYDLKQ